MICWNDRQRKEIYLDFIVERLKWMQLTAARVFRWNRKRSARRKDGCRSIVLIAFRFDGETNAKIYSNSTARMANQMASEMYSSSEF
jgi:hypothetical protein